MNQSVCEHELGHDQLHREFTASNTLQKFTLYDMNSIQEYETNVLAADLLLEDDAVFMTGMTSCGLRRNCRAM